MTRTCPLCGTKEGDFPEFVRALGLHDSAIAAAWRAHLAACAGGDDTRAIAVTIPFKVKPPVSPDTNHVTYSCPSLGLEYRFYYPDYLDREKCLRRIAEVQPYPDTIIGAAKDELPRNELCDALMQWRAMVAAKHNAGHFHEAYMKLVEEHSAFVQSRVWYRIKKYFRRLLHGERNVRPAAGVGQ